jgi:hypothetical protein
MRKRFIASGCFLSIAAMFLINPFLFPASQGGLAISVFCAMIFGLFGAIYFGLAFCSDIFDES